MAKVKDYITIGPEKFLTMEIQLPDFWKFLWTQYSRVLS